MLISEYTCRKALVEVFILYFMSKEIDEKDLQILRILQSNCSLSVKTIARMVNSPITTVHAKIKRLEGLGYIKSYKAVLDSKKLGKTVTAFILVSFAYTPPTASGMLSQRDVAKDIAKFPEVQEVHIITGDWDLLIKVKASSIDEIGRFVVDKLRTVHGVEKTLTCVVFDSIKECFDISF